MGLREAAGAVDEALAMPLLHVPEINIPYARRLQCWQFSVLIHSFTTILCIWKDNHTTMVRYYGPIFLLSASIGQLAYLLWCYPIAEDVFTTGLIVCFGVSFYAMIAITDIICFWISNISITLEILLIAFTVCMHVLRFIAQDLFQFSRARLFIALVGVIPIVPALFGLYDLFSKPDTVSLLSKPDTVILVLVDGHIFLKISVIISALFRLLDVMFMSIPLIREVANYLQGKLQEFFI